MQFRKLRFWPKTLAVQLIVVTAVAVVISNAGVALWFERGNQLQTETNLNERMLDRAAGIAATLKSVPEEKHGVVTRTMSTGIWNFMEMKGPAPRPAMTDDEQAFAQRLITRLPPEQFGRNHVSFKIGMPLETLPQGLPRFIANDDTLHRSKMMQAYVPLTPDSYLFGAFISTPKPAPIEIIVAATAAIVVTSAAAAIMARRTVRPLSELAKAASAMTGSGVVPHVAENGPEDVRAAAAAFNTMAAKVTHTLESQRHLLSAVGHDLRTPLTAMRINLEFVEDDDLRERLLFNLDELQDLTEQVLASARGTNKETRRNVDLSALVESLCADLDELSVPVAWQTHAPAPISCSPNEIRRAVRNLVENAVAYGGKAEVHIRDTQDSYEILVEDEGPGIPEADRQRVFEPFVRLEGSRNREVGGTGLGLTLVKAIAEGHGGKVTLENRNGGGLRARMCLPRKIAA